MGLQCGRVFFHLIIGVLILALTPKVSNSAIKEIKVEKNKSIALTTYEFEIIKNSKPHLSKDQILEKINETALIKATQICLLEKCGSNQCVKAIKAGYIIPDNNIKSLGVWFDSITCSDQEFEEKIDQKFIESLSETISLLNRRNFFENLNSCSINYGPLAIGLLKFGGAAALMHASKNLLTSEKDDKFLESLAKSAGATALGFFANDLNSRGLENLKVYTDRIPENVKKFNEFEVNFKNEKSNFENKLKKMEIFDLNIVPLKQMFEKIEEEIERQKSGILKSNRDIFADGRDEASMKSMINALNYIRTTLNLPSNAKTISEKAGNSLVSYFTKEMTYGDKEIAALDDLIELIENNSILERKAIPATMYFEGAPGVGKTTLAHGLAQKLELDWGELSVSPDSQPREMEQQLVKILSRSQSKNPIIVMDEFGDLFQKGVKAEKIIKFFKTFLGGKQTYLPLPPPKMESSMGMSVAPDFIVPTYVDASRATFIGTGNFEIPEQEQALASRFTLKLRVKNKTRDEKIEISKKILQGFNRNEVLSEPELNMVTQAVDFDEMNKEPGVRVLEKVMQGYGQYLIDQQNGLKRKVRLTKPKESEPFNFHKYYSEHPAGNSSSGHTSRSDSISGDTED